MTLGPIDDPIERVFEETKAQALLRMASEIERLRRLVMTPEQLDALRALLAPLVAVVATCPMTDDDDKATLMRLWCTFNNSVLNADDHS